MSILGGVTRQVPDLKRIPASFGKNIKTCTRESINGPISDGYTRVPATRTTTTPGGYPYNSREPECPGPKILGEYEVSATRARDGHHTRRAILASTRGKLAKGLG